MRWVRWKRVRDFTRARSKPRALALGHPLVCVSDNCFNITAHNSFLRQPSPYSNEKVWVSQWTLGIFLPWGKKSDNDCENAWWSEPCVMQLKCLRESLRATLQWGREGRNGSLWGLFHTNEDFVHVGDLERNTGKARWRWGPLEIRAKETRQWITTARKG